MKKIFYLMCCVLTAFLVGCESSEPSGSSENSSASAKRFSVSATKTVTFSPGNLQYHAANNEWRFAPNQTDYIGRCFGGHCEIEIYTDNGWIDMFGWGTGNNPTNNSKNDEDYSIFVDWGVNKIGNYAPNTWRTLTGEEWEYLISKRVNAYDLIGIAQVDGVAGLIILPNDWKCPIGVAFKSGFANFDGKIGLYQNFTASDWSKLEASGAVFLPAGRSSISEDPSSELGYYWTASEYNKDIAVDVHFYSVGMYVRGGKRVYGHSVRLVKD